MSIIIRQSAKSHIGVIAAFSGLFFPDLPTASPNRKVSGLSFVCNHWWNPHNK